MYGFTQDWVVIKTEDGAYPSPEEARKGMILEYSRMEDISYDLAYLIFKKRDKINRLTLEIQEMKLEYSQDKERLNMDDARRYVPLVPRIERETYKETSERLSIAIGKRIDKDVFHKAVKLIRTKTL